MSAALGIDEAQLSRLARIHARRLSGAPLLPHGQRPRRDRAGRGLELLDLKPVEAGGIAERIDWRATVRSGRPVERRARDEASHPVTLCLDASSSMATSSAQRWLLARQLVAALAFMGLEAGHRVSVVAFADDAQLLLAPSQGRRAYAALARRLDAIAEPTPGHTSHLEACSRFVSTGGSAVVISDFLRPDFLRPGLEALAMRRATVQLVHIPTPSKPIEDESLGEQTLVDVESGERRTLHIGPETEQSVTRRIEALGEALHSYCRSQHIAVTTCPPGASWLDVLTAQLAPS